MTEVKETDMEQARLAAKAAYERYQADQTQHNLRLACKATKKYEIAYAATVANKPKETDK
jgi:hypothetical protein